MIDDCRHVLKNLQSYPRAQTLNYASLAAILISAVLTVWMFIMITQIKLIRFMLLSTNLPLTGISGIQISAKTIFPYLQRSSPL